MTLIFFYLPLMKKKKLIKKDRKINKEIKRRKKKTKICNQTNKEG